MSEMDFDQFIAERQKTAPTFKAFGKVYHLPPTMPYDAIFKFKALDKRKKNDVIKDDELFALFESLVGKDTVLELRAHREFDIDLMMRIMDYVLNQYGMKTKQNPKDVKTE